MYLTGLWPAIAKCLIDFKIYSSDLTDIIPSHGPGKN